tara:strand:- start:197 stop:568 length:372 start_codon:yes stop_codon:yes gene_type:complete
MPKGKKRTISNSEQPEKKRKIETAADAVRALDDPIFDLLPGISDFNTPTSPVLPVDFFNNHVLTEYKTIGQVYMTIDLDENIFSTLTGDVESLIKSHQRWELIARKLKEKCIELKNQLAVFFP